MRTFIRDAQVVNEGKTQKLSVLIDGEHIVAILPPYGPVPLGCDDVVDADGMILMPGAIDAHVHFRDPGLTHKADMSTESAAAVAGGVTTVMDMPNTNPQTVTAEALHNKFADAAGKMHTNYSFYVGATNSNIPELLRLDYTRICGIKLFLGSSTGNMLVNDATSLRSLFSEAPVIIAAHCEDESVIKANSERAKELYADAVPWREHANIRSAEACLRSATFAAGLAKKYGARLHIMHVSTADELSLLDDGAEPLVTGEACLAHILFTSDDFERLGPLIKCNPSVKTENDRRALREAVADGRIATVGTDHAPHTLAEKTGHSYWQTPSGMPMIQHSLLAMLKLADEGWWSYAVVAERMAHAPARIYRIDGRGFIRPGYKADLVLLRPQSQVVGTTLYKCGWTPLLGDALNHVVERTYVSGRLAYANGEVLPGYGQELKFIR